MRIRHVPIFVGLVWSVVVLPSLAGAEDAVSSRLPAGVPPVLGMWAWSEPEFAPQGYRAFLDLAAEHAAYNLITTTLRIPKKELTDDDVHAQIKEAAAYARRRGMALVMDLDVRLARAAFQQAHPDELQEMLRLRVADLNEAAETTITVTPETPSDHYTFRATPYVPLAGRLVRVYAYVRGPEGIEPETMQDITSTCRVDQASARQVTVTVGGGAEAKGRQACAIVAFRHFAPDVFAPHLPSFQRDLLRRYADCELAGACKDEWGFPPCYDGCPAKNDYWYSESMAAAYAQRTGRDLVHDCLLMYLGQRGREGERQAAINQFMELCWQRNGAIEDDFYRAVKEVFGPQAVVATHPTWWPNPDTREFKKNGLDWWVATRDWAQTDEVTPFCVRTALAKKWGSPVWYNMYYSTRLEDYRREIWATALSGGRVNFHPVYPAPPEAGSPYEAVMRGGLPRGDCRIRLLNFISKAPLDCPVAIVFGHACAMNWAGPAYDDVGLQVADGLRQAGYPADLIPADEIAARSLVLDADGFVRYGPQPYAVVVLYHPQFEKPATAAFFRQAAGGKTTLLRVGRWTAGFDGRPFDGDAALPPEMAVLPDVNACVAAAVEQLRARGIAPQSPSNQAVGWDRRHLAPAAAGQCRLLDGTVILAAGEQDAAGDPIRTSFEVNGRKVQVDCVGLVAVRFEEDGHLEALAAGGLRRFETDTFRLALEQPVDLALWRQADGEYAGVLQDCPGPVPPPLAAITARWSRLAVPTPPGEAAEEPAATVDATTLRGRIMCGYQGWFRCPGDATGNCWTHWSRDCRQLTPQSLCFDLWPDTREFAADELFAAPGFKHADGRQAHLFSSDNPRTVLRHFEWMRDYGIDGAWLQHFLVDLPGSRMPDRYATRMRVLDHVRKAAGATGRTWALSYDIAGMRAEQIFDVLAADWKRMVDDKVIDDPRYLHHAGRPVVQVWGFYRDNRQNSMSPELANKILDLFAAPGPYAAFFVGGGDWDWRKNPDPQWQQFQRRFDAYVPWNVGNWSGKPDAKRASMSWWADDKRECEARGTMWIPSVYPGFSWGNLQRHAPNVVSIPRRRGEFLWEQFYELARLKVDTVFVAMFDEVDEGTAIFKLASDVPVRGWVIEDDEVPNDWYLRLVGEGARMLRGRRPITAEMPRWDAK